MPVYTCSKYRRDFLSQCDKDWKIKKYDNLRLFSRKCLPDDVNSVPRSNLFMDH